MRLPIDDILPEVVTAIRTHGRAVLQAPPGAGKTTRVPLALLEAVAGRIIMLEPRRLAARAAAERLAEQMGEAPGQTVGYRMRGATKPGRRIEVVTEGILTRMIQSDPELTGIGAVIFDEFHERSLQADLGLALCLEIRAALRPDLALVAMSATLDAAPVAALMDDAPILTSEGRSFPVEEIWLDRPNKLRLAEATADLIVRASEERDGSILAFLPGAPEIRRTEAALAGRLSGTDIRPLYGGLPFAAQRAAIAPGRRRKVVLATSIAETSLTIEDIRIVVDAGRARRARFDPGSGMSRLVTERVTRAEAIQRAGRAGRVAPGAAYKLWTKGEDGALAAAPPPEIAAADLAPLALDLALWGSADLPFLTAPPEVALGEARALLRDLGALDHADRITDHGRTLAAMPLHPRLAHMLAMGGPSAAPLAALLSDRDPMQGAGSDLALRLKALPKDPAFAAIRTEAKRLAKTAPKAEPLTPAEQAALAYPDRIALRRPGDAPRYLLSGGKGAYLAEDDPLAGQRLLVACDLDGDAREARIRLAAPLSEGALRALYGDRIVWYDVCEWSRREGRVIARRQERFGAITLDDRVWKDAPTEAIARAMLDGVRELGLRLDGPAVLFRARVEAVRAAGKPLPPMDDAHLTETLDDWLLPHLTGVKTAGDWRRFDTAPALRAMLSWDQTQTLDRFAPAQFRTPTGRTVPVDYSGETPAIAVKLQEMFGQSAHPRIAGQPLQITLLSPAGRPLQVTSDLPGFWTGAYVDVRKDMRGRYPKHPWPEDPLAAEPTLRVKRRG
ncbi:ATP-dependent helicase HrpB [Aestuariibius sp. 2305UL40-4]|uniref:ATP-dependent helicase HrpB n=1 Tax=Aestuariibius violaceus TaxID=3234132 RepID=UPI00345E1966